MKSYLNKEEREIFLKVAVMSGYIEDMSKLNLDTQNEIKYFKTAFTALNKASVHLINRLDSKFASQIQRGIDSSEFIMVSHSRAKMELEENQATQEAIDKMAEKALYWCCECKEPDKKECLLRKAFKGLNIPKCNGNTSECPYEPV